MSDSSLIVFEVIRRRFSSSSNAQHLVHLETFKTFNKRPIKVVPVFVLMLCEFIVCFLPPILLLNINIANKHLTEDFIHLSVGVFSLFNPFIYCWRLKCYRKAFVCIVKGKKVARKVSFQLRYSKVYGNLVDCKGSLKKDALCMQQSWPYCSSVTYRDDEDMSLHWTKSNVRHL